LLLAGLDSGLTLPFTASSRLCWKGRRLWFTSAGEQTGDFTYVTHAVQGTMQAPLSDIAGDAFDIGRRSGVAVNEVIRLLEGVIGHSA